ncbi:hypothetical protein K470DRAFT_254390 [Piedraia hortae CBS 480.64]|uniref:Uncharacterized protein n=1 Tax=Piedraia hortae CBS 480.64 TaxID=1314780 RepID=A0A6A7C9E1_9PEZI|nr:hypothetical protein K470DRAFT_254390 [Piedraia hortae CBS 480.64]
MVFLHILFAATVAFSSAMAVPTATAVTSSVLPSPTSEAHQQIMSNWSFAVGNFYAGSADSTASLQPICKDIGALGHGQWSRQGLSPELIQRPICNMTRSENVNPSIAIPWTIRSLSDMFTTQLLGAFDGQYKQSSLGYVCNNTQYQALDAYNIDSQRVVNATCHAAGLEMRPQLVEPLTTPNMTDASVYIEALSALYGITLASTARDMRELDGICHAMDGRMKALNAMHLNGSIVLNGTCGRYRPHSEQPMGGHSGGPLPEDGSPMLPHTAFDLVRVQMTRMFTIVLKGMNRSLEWNSWLCQNLNIDGLNNVGLIGDGVTEVVCQARGAVG